MCPLLVESTCLWLSDLQLLSWENGECSAYSCLHFCCVLLGHDMPIWYKPYTLTSVANLHRWNELQTAAAVQRAFSITRVECKSIGRFLGAKDIFKSCIYRDESKHRFSNLYLHSPYSIRSARYHLRGKKKSLRPSFVNISFMTEA